MNRVADKVAFITGIARGQGRAHALRLAEEGADIIGVDICDDIPVVEYPLATEDDLAETASMVEELGRKIIVGKADVRDPGAMQGVLDEGVNRLGRLDFVVANAGVMPIWGRLGPTREAWQTCLDIMLTGVMNTVELTYPILRDRGEGGSIVMTGSMAAWQPMMRTEGSHTLGLLGYASAKHALINLARNYASFLAPHRIRVNTIHPTGVDTAMINNDMLLEHFNRATDEDRLVLVNAMPVDRVQPVDIANLVLFLCSEEARYITGSAIRVDAGANLR